MRSMSSPPGSVTRRKSLSATTCKPLTPTSRKKFEAVQNPVHFAVQSAPINTRRDRTRAEQGMPKTLEMKPQVAWCLLLTYQGESVKLAKVGLEPTRVS